MSALKLMCVAVLAGLALAGAWASCGPSLVRNPERDQCAQRCVAEKNACMLSATNSPAIAACDDAVKACGAQCQSIPAYVPGS